MTNDGGLITLSCGKSKDSAHFEPQYLRVVKVGESCVIVPAERVDTTRHTPDTAPAGGARSASVGSVREAGAKASELLEILGIPRKSLYRAFDPLLRQGYVSQAAKGDPDFLIDKGRVSVCHDTPCDTSSQTSTHGVGTGISEAISSAGISHQDAKLPGMSLLYQGVSDTVCHCVRCHTPRG